MERRKAFFPLIFVGFWLVLAVLACNLTDSAPPPTIVPRASATPPPTIGYATLAPDEYPQEATNMPRTAPRPDTTLVNVMNQVEPDRLIMHVDALVGMGTRHVLSSWTTPNQGIGGAYNYITNHFNEISAQSYQNSFMVLQPHEFPFSFAGQDGVGRNIIGLLQGTETGAGIIVIGAHYDSISLDFENPNAYAPGANDNASGVAALIEIARVMSQRPHRATVMFVAFSAEEIQRKGSISFVNDYLRANNIEINAMFNLDIVGSNNSAQGAVNDSQMRIFSDEPNESTSRQLARALNLIVSRHVPGMELVVESTVDRGGRYGDHMSFSEAGYPAVRFVEPVEEGDRHHTSRDTLEDVQVSYLLRVAQTVVACATALADGLQPPRSVQLREATEGQRTLVWERVPEAASYVVALRPPGSLIYDPFFETNDTTVTWDGFVSSRFIGVAIAAKDASGLIGPFSFEYAISN